MKTVFTNSEICHTWAHQNYEHGRTSNGSIFFKGRVIYSYGYHFPMAAISEGGTVFLTYRGYSNTTAKHLGKVRAAISHERTIYCYNPEEAVKGQHNGNLTQWEQTCFNLAQNLQKAKKPGKYLQLIAQEYEQAKTYADYFGLDLTDPKHALKYLFIANTEQAKELIEQAEQAEAQRKAEQAKREAEQIKKNIRKFRLFKTNNTNTGEFTYLRFNESKNRVETSKGVEIPLEIAKRAFNWVTTKLNGGGCTECEYKILDFKVSTLNKSELTVGCHTIQMTEINRLAKKLGWL